VLLMLALVVPFAVVAAGAPWLAGALGARMARRLAGAAEPLEAFAPLGCGESHLAEWLWPSAPCTGEADALELRMDLDRLDPVARLDSLSPPRSNARSDRALTRPPRKPAARRPPSGLLIAAPRVRAAARHGVRPTGVPVPAGDGHPAGLALLGVSALGLGVRDGDVLTRAAGSPATSPEAVLHAVTAAVHRGDPVITGEVWRGSHRMVVTVEVPKRRRARASR
jgi:hypothetical protein